MQHLPSADNMHGTLVTHRFNSYTWFILMLPRFSFALTPLIRYQKGCVWPVKNLVPAISKGFVPSLTDDENRKVQQIITHCCVSTE